MPVGHGGRQEQSPGSLGQAAWRMLTLPEAAGGTCTVGNWKESERHVQPAAIAAEKAAGRQVVGFLSDAEPRHVTGQPARRAFQWLLFLTICLSLVKVSSAAYSEGRVGLASLGHLVGTKGHSDEALTTAQRLNMKWVSKHLVWVPGLNSPRSSHGEAKPSLGQQARVPTTQFFQLGAHTFPTTTVAPKDAHILTPEPVKMSSCMVRGA